ncbi:baseplate wedge protein 53 [Staphylococcus sp. SQ8-PEA]|uniref:Baseplate wedge protein 53 n=1 Tax=Staphylococcus marylandisciuri TaxID=2981529 RepID=A0ABT2QPC5_9STAP|nr:baseplate wedge protein 53 [Staphylococcus marylandisciuri]MCU5745831.1 baseplate wedge protein 53 [Staphylococcus marylandisciuri]
MRRITSKYMTNNDSMQLITDLSDLEERIPKNDVVRIVKLIVDSVPETKFDVCEERFGMSVYYSKIMLKIILYAYTQSKYSGEEIELALRDSTRMMWLAQMHVPTFDFINHFRSIDKINNLVQTLYINLRSNLIKQQLIDTKSEYVDIVKENALIDKQLFVWNEKFEENNNYNQESKEVYQELLNTKILPSIKYETE